MTTLKIPTPLRYYTDGQAEVTVSGADVATAMRNLVTQYPTLEQHLYNGNGDLRNFVNLFLGENNIKDLQGLETPLNDGDTLRLIPSIAGGSNDLSRYYGHDFWRNKCSPD
jgi:molybdopterin converting factor small subunit